MTGWAGFCYFVLYAVTVVTLIWAGERKYEHGVWDGTHNPTIPPVKRALERLHKSGWRR